MRVESIGLRSWLLGVFVAWALLVCILALVGLGGHIALSQDAAQAAPLLPSLPAAAGERLGAIDRYAEIDARPVFAQDRLPHPFYLNGGGGDSGDNAALRLTGVLLTPQLRMATLTTEQGQSLRLRLQGEAVSGWKLLELAPRTATVDGPGGTRTLQLQVFNGQGGQPVSATPARTGDNPGPAPAGTADAKAGAATPGVGAAAPAKPDSGAAPPPAPTNAPSPTEAQLQAIRQRIEARRRQLRDSQQNNSRNGQ